MAQVIVRNLEPKTVALLKARAKRHGRSLEAELRWILAASVAAGADEEFVSWVREHRLPGTPDFDAAEAIRTARDARTKAILDAAGTDR
jgi:plasmid stability protein